MKGITKETVNSGIPIFQKVIETAQGGFSLQESVLAANAEVKAGTIIGYDETTRVAKVAKYAVNKNLSGANDTTYEVYKGHNLAVGMSVKVAGGAAFAITTIDTTSPNHDVITVGTTLSASAVAVGAAIYVDDDGYSKAKGLLFNDAIVETGTDVAVVIRGTVYENRIAPVPDALKTLLPNLIFSKSF